jgi:predicted RND superfamily exporter protein
MFDRFAVFLLRHRIAVVVTALAVTGLLASSMVPLDRIRFDFSFRRLFQFDGEEASELTRFKNTFGDDAGSVGLLYLTGSGSASRCPALAPDIAASMRRLHEWLRSREELDQGFTISPVMATDFFAEPMQGEALGLALPEVPDRTLAEWGQLWRNDSALPEALASYAAIAERISRHRLYRGMFISDDGTATALLFRFNLAHNHPTSRREFLGELAEKLEVERAALGRDITVETFGIPVVTEEYARLSVQDIVRTAPLSLLMMSLFLFLLFRSATAVILPQVVVMVGVICAIGFMQWTDEPLNIISHIVPVVVLVVGVADAVHIISRYGEERNAGVPVQESVRKTVSMLSKACFLTSATTAIGFASLTTATIATIASFGLYTAIAVMFTFVVNMTLLPVSLSAFGPRPRRPGGGARLNGWLEALAHFSVRHARVIFVSGVLLSVAAVIYVIFNLGVNNHLLEEVPESNPVSRATMAMERRLSPVIPHEVVVRGKVHSDSRCRIDSDCVALGTSHPANLVCITSAQTQSALAPMREGFGALVSPAELAPIDTLTQAIDRHRSREGLCVESVKDPGLLRALDAVGTQVMADASANEHVGRIESFASLVVQLHHALKRGAPEALAVPDTRAAVSQLLLPVESADQGLLDRYTTLDYDAARMTLFLRDHGSSGWHAVRSSLETALSQHLTGDSDLQDRFDVTITGTMTFVEKALSFIVHDMLLSVSTAFFFIFLLMVLLFRSLRIGLLSILPNIFPLVATLWLMAVAGIELRTATIIIFSISLGIAVNDTIHFIARYNEELSRGARREAAIVSAMRSAGRAMIVTTLILAGGFLVDLISEFVALRQFGYLASFTLLMALLGDLLILPACLILFHRVKEEG